MHFPRTCRRGSGDARSIEREAQHGQPEPRRYQANGMPAHDLINRWSIIVDYGDLRPTRAPRIANAGDGCSRFGRLLILLPSNSASIHAAGKLGYRAFQGQTLSCDRHGV